MKATWTGCLFRWLLAAALVPLLAGCGYYHMGSMTHPQLKTIGLAPVVNETLTPFATADMRGMLSEQFMFDGSLKVKEVKEADCILYCRITDIKTTESMTAGYDNEKNYQTAQWKVVVTAEFTVILPSHKEPLIPKRKVTGEALFEVYGDATAQQRRATKMACRAAAEMIVEYTTEAW